MTEQPPTAKKPRPGSATFAVWLQLLLAVFLAISAVTGFLYGADAEEAFEAELANQGVDVSQLPDNSSNFGGDATSLVISIVLILILVVLALLNGAGNRVGRILTWIFQPIVLICGGFIVLSQLFFATFLQAAFDNSGDSQLEALDVQALVDAAFGAYPGWTTIVDWAVAILATLGSILVIILLAVPASNAYFRKEAPPNFIPGAPTQ